MVPQRFIQLLLVRVRRARRRGLAAQWNSLGIPTGSTTMTQFIPDDILNMRLACSAIGDGRLRGCSLCSLDEI
jgi:hypothetical protein